MLPSDVNQMPRARPPDRNYACRVSDDYLYRGLRVVVLENEKLRVGVLADKGTDIFELLYKPLDIDFMYRSPSGVRSPASFIPTTANPSGAYLDFWEGGWQEAFPIGGGACNYKGAAFGLHGEVSLMPWQHSIIEDDDKCVAVYFWVRTCRTPFLMEKILRLNTNEPILRVWERVTNESQVTMDFMWGQHPAIGRPFLGPDCKVSIPAESVVVPDSAEWPTSRLKEGTYRWPMVQDRGGHALDISKIASPQTGTAEAAYLTGLKEGWFAITSQRWNLVFAVSWPKEVYPWVWYWHVAGGELSSPFYGRNYNVALEPFTSYPNQFEKVLAAGSQRTLAPYESLEVDLTVSVVSRAGRVQSVTSEGEVCFTNP